MANNRCPAVILAANRTPNVIALMEYDINSIGTISGANKRGVPTGKNCDHHSNLWFKRPIKVQANQILILIPIATTTCAVGVKVYGTIPTKFIVANNKNKVKINGKYLAPSAPKFSLTSPLTCS